MRTLAFALIGVLLGSVAWATEPRLQLAWPDGWEFREPVAQRSTIRLQARQRSHNQTVQQLEMIVIDARAAQQPVTKDSVRELAEQLRDAALATAQERTIGLQSMQAQHGYFFVSTDRRYDSSAPAQSRQSIEGVMLREDWVITFALATDDAGSDDTQRMLHSLERLTISARKRSH